MKPIYIENGVIVYYGNRVGRVSKNCAVVVPMFKGQELNDFLKNQRNIKEVKWLDGVFDRLMTGSKDAHESQALKNCRVWQLKPDVDIRMKFIRYDKLCRNFGPPNPDNYQCVFDGMVDTNDLDALYTKFDMDHPPGYHGHAISISDVLELYDGSGSSFHYIDRVGFKQVDFEPMEHRMEPQTLSM
nr:YodL domain-containing protein [uncultured Eisenbergiella sp.]